MLGEAVEEVFDWLRPRNSRYKTNTEFEIGPKVILAYVVGDVDSWTTHYRVDHRYQKDLVALENVFSALDGRGSIAKGSWQSELADAINQTPVNVGRGETRYFKFRCFKNRNLHLEFKRPDLVDKLNQIAGGMRLSREARGERSVNFSGRWSERTRGSHVPRLLRSLGFESRGSGQKRKEHGLLQPE